MESAASLSSSHQLHQLHQQQSTGPFDPFRDPFESNSRGDQEHDGGNDDVPQSWSSGGNNSDRSPLPLNNHRNGTNGLNGSGMDTEMQGVKIEAGQKLPEPKKKRFICPHCTRTFARSGHLQRHERSRIPLQDAC
jgi:uncharacterized Zn-finger protein